MSILERLKTDTLEERKARGVNAALLVTIGSDIARRAKDDGGREATDDDATKVLRSYLAGLEENILVLPDGARKAEAVQQRDRLQGYLPNYLDGADLETEIFAAATEAGVPLEMRSMSAILTVLTRKFPGRVDGKAVSVFIKSRAGG